MDIWVVLLQASNWPAPSSSPAITLLHSVCWQHTKCLQAHDTAHIASPYPKGITLSPSAVILCARQSARCVRSSGTRPSTPATPGGASCRSRRRSGRCSRGPRCSRPFTRTCSSCECTAAALGQWVQQPLSGSECGDGAWCRALLARRWRQGNMAGSRSSQQEQRQGWRCGSPGLGRRLPQGLKGMRVEQLAAVYKLLSACRTPPAYDPGLNGVGGGWLDYETASALQHHRGCALTHHLPCPAPMRRCLLSHCYNAAADVVSEDIFDVAPQQTTCTPTDLFLYCYYGGMVCIGGHGQRCLGCLLGHPAGHGSPQGQCLLRMQVDRQHI